ncbi:hypothetical protein AVEN_194758-1 [Araneus ventricosus]|uniref:Uncharacterized protein n=1 Tax=Araneus ventricosus TaxID=182803 RepID=A0A4Y2B5B7_ARAVE|nr:hypothetical protein AVEN_194758-1 [Araneus ventricosus]
MESHFHHGDKVPLTLAMYTLTARCSSLSNLRIIHRAQVATGYRLPKTASEPFLTSGKLSKNCFKPGVSGTPVAVSLTGMDATGENSESILAFIFGQHARCVVLTSQLITGSANYRSAPTSFRTANENRYNLQDITSGQRGR